MHEIASMKVESKEDVKYVCSQIDGFVDDGRPINVGIRVRNKSEAESARKAIGHLHKEGRHITVTITEDSAKEG